MESKSRLLSLAIPNEETVYIYETTIMAWIDKKIADSDTSSLYKAIMQGDTGKMEEQISSFLMETISFYDYAENYYHGFLTGLLKNMAHYETLSNREAGEGRPDIMLKPGNIAKGVAVILELKAAKSFQEMEEKC